MPHHFKVHDGAYPHFITNSVVYGIPAFCREQHFRLLTDSLRYCVANKGLLVHAFVLMPNHFHAVCSQTDGKISDVLRDLKRHTASQMLSMLKEGGYEMWIRALTNAGGGKGKLWDDAFHPMEVHSKEFFEQKLAYIHNNPVKAGFVELPQHWKYSSAGLYYDEAESPVPVAPLEW